SIDYSADGTMVFVAASHFPFVLAYHLDSGVLMKRFALADDSASPDKKRMTNVEEKGAIRVVASHTGRQFLCLTDDEGVFLFSRENFQLFDPFLMDIEITPQSIQETLSTDHLKALVMALRLNH